MYLSSAIGRTLGMETYTVVEKRMKKAHRDPLVPQYMRVNVALQVGKVETVE